MSSSHPIAIPELTLLKRWTVADYHRMSELGILAADERTELLAGQITLMAAKGSAHVTSLQLLADAFRDRLGSAALVRTQDPVHLDDFSEPEPDLALVAGSVWDYSDRHPRSDRVYLLVEVADSTLKQDCELKDKLYARAGIVEYWVLDLPNRQFHLFRDPTPAGYARHLVLSEPNSVSPLAFPKIAIALSAILPPRSS